MASPISPASRIPDLYFLFAWFVRSDGGSDDTVQCPELRHPV